MSDLRQTILADEEIIASKRRFGLFSQPPPIAVGDDGQYKKIQRIKSMMQMPRAKMASRSPKLLKCCLELVGQE